MKFIKKNYIAILYVVIMIALCVVGLYADELGPAGNVLAYLGGVGIGAIAMYSNRPKNVDTELEDEIWRLKLEAINLMAKITTRDVTIDQRNAVIQEVLEGAVERNKAKLELTKVKRQNDTLKGDKEQLKTAIEMAMDIKDLWEPPKTTKEVPPENHGEMMALANMRKTFETVLTEH